MGENKVGLGDPNMDLIWTTCNLNELLSQEKVSKACHCQNCLPLANKCRLEDGLASYLKVPVFAFGVNMHFICWYCLLSAREGSSYRQPSHSLCVCVACCMGSVGGWLLWWIVNSTVTACARRDKFRQFICDLTGRIGHYEQQLEEEEEMLQKKGEFSIGIVRV